MPITAMLYDGVRPFIRIARNDATLGKLGCSRSSRPSYATGCAGGTGKNAREQSDVDRVLSKDAEDMARENGIGLSRAPDPVLPLEWSWR